MPISPAFWSWIQEPSYKYNNFIDEIDTLSLQVVIYHSLLPDSDTGIYPHAVS